MSRSAIPESVQLEKLAPLAANRYTFERLGEYVGSSTVYSCACLACSHTWERALSRLLMGRGCSECSKKTNSSQAPVPEDVQLGNLPMLTNGLYSLTREVEYVGYKTKYRATCTVCAHTWSPTLQTLLKGCGCPECAKGLMAEKKIIPEDQQLEKLTPIKGVKYSIERLEPYWGSRTQYRCTCSECGGNWDSKLSRLLEGHGCPDCKDKRIAESLMIPESARVERLSEIASDRRYTFERVGEFNGIDYTKYKCTCLDCSSVWSSTLASLLRLHGCPSCQRRGFRVGSPGTLYVMESECKTMVKVGISNNPNRRLTQLRKATPFKFRRVAMISHDDGAKIAQLEKDIHAKMERVDFGGDIFQGYTEWMKADPALFGWLKDAAARIARS